VLNNAASSSDDYKGRNIVVAEADIFITVPIEGIRGLEFVEVFPRSLRLSHVSQAQKRQQNDRPHGPDSTPNVLTFA